MAASKKKVVSKDDLRRLMKQKQSSVKEKTKKIEHPLAKYNNIGQLVCVLCNSILKSDILWTPHIQSKQHKVNFSALKDQQSNHSNAGIKRKTDNEQVPGDCKKPKENNIDQKRSTGLPSDFFDASSAGLQSNQSALLTPAAANILPGGLGAYSDSDSDEDDVSSSEAESENLPADFSDKDASSESALVQTPKVISEALPEGFFDDPKMDAKVRKVEYHDKMEEEWELFQKTMKEQTHVSEAILEEDNVAVNAERNIDEIDEQMHRWSELNNMDKEKELVVKTLAEKKYSADSDEDIDDDELEDFMNWRSKKTSKS